MSGFPEQLYRKSNRDQLVTGLNPFFRTASLSVPAANVTVTIAVPFDSALMLHLLTGIALPGGAQTLSFARFFLEQTPGQLVTLGGYPQGKVSGDVGTQFITQACNGLLIPPSAILTFRATFNLFAAANFAEFSVAGLLIPRANISAL